MSEEEYDPTRVDAQALHGEPKVQTPEVEPSVPSIPHTEVIQRTAPSEQADPSASTAQMAQQSRKELRRERDAQAEKMALRVLLFVFLGVGGLGWGLINSGVIDLGGPVSGGGEADKKPVPTAPVLTAPPVESAKIPALESMEREGLTIVAEGLPEVVAIQPARPPQMLVGIESCRYTFAIWEFSPNKRFRFMTTCELLKGEILAGAWHREGSEVLLSPLTSAGSQMRSRFEVEKPSRMVTDIEITAPNAKPVKLMVRQRITGMRPGMEGAGFLRVYEPRNTVKVQGIRIVPEKVSPSPQNKAPTSPKPNKPSGDSLLDLLE